MSQIDVEVLEEEYGLTGSVLEQASRSLVRSGANQLVKELPSLDEALSEEIPVKGIGYGGRRTAAALARPGMSATLRREYDNPVDRNAVTIGVADRVLGYLRRDLAQLLAPELDSGLPLRATFASVDRTGLVPKVSVRLSVSAL